MLNPAATAYSNRPNGKILEKRARKWIATIGETEETKFNAEDKKARFAGRRSAKRADLESATGRRSAALRVQFLGGGVKLNNPKIGGRYNDYKKQICIADMRTLELGHDVRFRCLSQKV